MAKCRAVFDRHRLLACAFFNHADEDVINRHFVHHKTTEKEGLGIEQGLTSPRKKFSSIQVPELVFNLLSTLAYMYHDFLSGIVKIKYIDIHNEGNLLWTRFCHMRGEGYRRGFCPYPDALYSQHWQNCSTVSQPSPHHFFADFSFRKQWAQLFHVIVQRYRLLPRIQPIGH